MILGVAIKYIHSGFYVCVQPLVIILLGAALVQMVKRSFAPHTEGRVLESRTWQIYVAIE